MSEFFNRGTPTNDAVTLREMKDALVIAHNEDDALIERITRAATSEFERYTDTSVIQRAHSLTVGATSFNGATKLRGDVVSLTSVNFTLKDFTVVPVLLTDVVLYQNSICFVAGYSFPSDLLSMTVIYEAGMGTDDLNVPDSVRQAIIDIAAFRYEFRGTDEYQLPAAVMLQLKQHRNEFF